MVACEVCLAQDHQPLFEKAGYRFERCRGCSHVRVQPDDVPGDLAAYYGRTFFADGGYADYVGDRVVLRRNFERFIRRIRRHGAGKRLFEIGCAHGFFLDLARRHWEVGGIDISPLAARYARDQLALDVVCGDFLDHPIAPSSVDVMVMWDTIEHLLHPAAYVQKIAECLKPGGLLALTTGDAGAVVPRLRGRRWRLYYPPEHLHFFSRATMCRLLARHGLKPVSIEPIGFSRSLDMMLHRMWADRKTGATVPLYRAAKAVGVTDIPVYLNLFDIMFVVAAKL